MSESEPSEASAAASFVDANLRGARFVRCDLSGATMRGVDVAGAEIDGPWLLEDGGTLLVNGVDVVPYVRSELERRFPGRALMRAADPGGLRVAWAEVEAAWAAALDRVASMPSGSADVSVDGEWSFAETLRHLVMATDVWLGRGILETDEPLHPIGMPNVEYATDGHDMSVFSQTDPTYDEVLAVRAAQQARVRGLIATVGADDLAAERRNPWSPEHPETVLACLHTILQEEWEHLRFATRDLDAIAGGS